MVVGEGEALRRGRVLQDAEPWLLIEHLAPVSGVAGVS